MATLRTLPLVLSLSAAIAVAFACDTKAPGQPRYYQGTLCSASNSGALFERRIAPLLADDRPSTCNECHLSGVDLSMFARSTPCETFACLRDQGLVDLDDVRNSQVLAFIQQADPESPLITQDVVDQEYQAFLEWLDYNVSCGSAACANAQCGAPHQATCEKAREPKVADVENAAEPMGCSDKDIEQLFLDSVYSSRGRCSPCHFDNWDENDLGSPSWIKTGGTCNQAALATLRQIERAGYIDIERPRRSLLLLKPLSDEQGGVVHGGGAKFHEGDSAYLNFTRFVEHYATCKGGPFDGGLENLIPDPDASADAH
ncbi:MAG TPA: hypothetical protein VHO25_05260 [Polyangiaceae bacterium]|nr:hypothetical protein [Polyangiaceae bacterium]